MKKYHKPYSRIISIFFGMRHVESSNAFVYLMNIPNGVVVSTILLKIIPAPVSYTHLTLPTTVIV